MKFIDLVSSLPAKEIVGNPETEVQGIAYDSRSVQQGYLFAAIRGLREDGTRFVPDALSRGACAILSDQPLSGCRAAQVIVPDAREALALISSFFYGTPSSFLTLVGITGTNGKTTTSYLIESILKEDGKNVGVMGTVNYRFGDRTLPAATTTPESLDLQKNLAAMVRAGVTHAALEVSSHSLDLQRVRGCHFDVALFTNLTRDHLDYHRSMEEYFEAKKLLFTRYLQESGKEKRFSVINMDDPYGVELAREASGLLFRYGVQYRGEVWPQSIEEGPEGIRCRVMTPRGSLEFSSPLIGRHNLQNILAAVSLGEALQVPQKAISLGIARLARVPGRLERVAGIDGIRIFVDYAHTPDALERALETLNQVGPGRLIVVFGCGGDRDRGKRPVMGKVAATRSGLAIITSDNPRTEDPLTIIREVEEGARVTGSKKYSSSALSHWHESPAYAVIPDRREAIRTAIQLARRGDLVLIAGKGHEDYQILGKVKTHFDDREEAKQALDLRGRGNL